MKPQESEGGASQGSSGPAPASCDTVYLLPWGDHSQGPPSPLPSPPPPPSPPEQPAPVLAEHEPDLTEGEFEGACNVCGGSHCYCVKCGTSFCIICEAGGCVA